jgi:uncharacterized membrane protein YeaQ/YmgE (transglycosylase-associated protein family)
MALLWMLIVGLLVGVLARLLWTVRPPGGVLMTLLLGVAGSFVAGFVGRGMGFYDAPGRGAAIVASLCGALLLPLVYRTLRARP